MMRKEWWKTPLSENDSRKLNVKLKQLFCESFLMVISK